MLVRCSIGGKAFAAKSSCLSQVKKRYVISATYSMANGLLVAAKCPGYPTKSRIAGLSALVRRKAASTTREDLTRAASFV
jgi:hypothetical protein